MASPEAVPPQAAGQDSNAGPLCESTQEIRFAVVMYGGVSLAIYIYGIAKELHQLALATAPVEAEGEAPVRGLPESALSGSAKVYRKIAQALVRDPASGRSLSPGTVKAEDPIRTRFVIDVISGTSAGGINGVFLAKALANDQSLDGLRELWIREGDIGVLLNDGGSIRGTDLQAQDPPRSLLNSERMYRKLLSAFQEMDKPVAGRPPVRLADSLDLAVTATDIRGVEVPLRLADGVASERRHRQAFPFSLRRGKGAQRNDFGVNSNRLLAFAARCTSSFPFAFEPMRLADLRVEKGDSASGTGDGEGLPEDWRRRLFDGYPQAMPDPRLIDRAFGDGGNLDNKPFGYAIEELMRRQADVPVDRKLIYIEPDPEHDQRLESPGRPDALEASVAAVLTLPRYETIREDLERILERNRLVERLNRMVRYLDEDVKYGSRGPLEVADWGDRDLKYMVAAYGISYGSYYRLKVSSVSDALASLVARASGIDERSDLLEAVQILVRAWRRQGYNVFRPQPTDEAYAERAKLPTLNRFLLDFDLDYRLRRINFIRNRIDLLSISGKRSEELLRHAISGKPPEALLEHAHLEEKDLQRVTDDRRAFVAELLWIKRRLNEAQGCLAQAKGELWSFGEANPLSTLVESIDIGDEVLKSILRQPTEDARFDRASKILAANSRNPALEDVARELRTRLEKVFKEVSGLCKGALLSERGADEKPLSRVARASVARFYVHYDDYDMVTFPTLATSEVGELDTVEVVRISPQDAPLILDERMGKRRKLAGTTFGHFGAFLEPAWRRNDLLWGRLDGAERLIACLLPGEAQKAVRETLTEEAHLAILEEEVAPEALKRLGDLLVPAALAALGERPEPTLRQRLELHATPPTPPVPERHIAGAAFKGWTSVEVLAHLKGDYEVCRQPSPKAMVDTLARGTRITGRILEAMAKDPLRKRLAWITRLGSLFWGLFIVAVPSSLPELFFQHWLKVLYLFEGLMIFLGGIAGSSVILRVAWISLGLTVLGNLSVFLLKDYLRGRMGRQRLKRVAAIVLMLGVVAFALAQTFSYWYPKLLGSAIGYLTKVKSSYEKSGTEGRPPAGPPPGKPSS